MKKYFLILLATIVFLPTVCYAQTGNLGDVLINEIAWMGTTNSANDEWLELFNATSNPIDLLGWKLLSTNGKLKINLKGVVAGHGFYLLERTDNKSVPNLPADLVYKGDLPNTGIYLTLYDTGNTIIDLADFTNGWILGDNKTKQTAERTNLSVWQTSKESNGTPRAQNSLGAQPEILPPLIVKEIPVMPIKKPAAIKKPEKKLPNQKKSDTTYLSALSQPVAPVKGDEASKENPWWLFWGILGVMVVAGVVAMIIKFKILFKKTIDN